MKILFNQRVILDAVNQIAFEINQENFDKEPPVMICVLNGAFMFFTDLVKNLNLDCEIDFIKAKTYFNSMNKSEVEIKSDITTNIMGKNVYIVDDILDSGDTMRALIKHLEYKKPRSITPVTLFKRHSNTWPTIHGIILEDESWLCGYGLDGDKGLYRNRSVIFGELKEVD
jgi:hypoxanthine phosphoribosyltransferase